MHIMLYTNIKNKKRVIIYLRRFVSHTSVIIVYCVSDTNAIFENINNDATSLPSAYDSNNSNNIITVVCMLWVAGNVMETGKTFSAIVRGGGDSLGLKTPGIFPKVCYSYSLVRRKGNEFELSPPCIFYCNMIYIYTNVQHSP